MPDGRILRRCKVIERSMIRATVTIEAAIRNQMGQPAAWIIENNISSKNDADAMPAAKQRDASRDIGPQAGRGEQVRDGLRPRQMNGRRAERELSGFFTTACKSGPKMTGEAVDNFVDMVRGAA
jgi:hypothetical protein